jgi:hypothetical protein
MEILEGEEKVKGRGYISTVGVWSSVFSTSMSSVWFLERGRGRGREAVYYLFCNIMTQKQKDTAVWEHQMHWGKAVLKCWFGLCRDRVRSSSRALGGEREAWKFSISSPLSTAVLFSLSPVTHSHTPTILHLHVHTALFLILSHLRPGCVCGKEQMWFYSVTIVIQSGAVV